MNLYLTLAAALVLASVVVGARAQTITWGSPLFTYLYDSNGVTWNDSINVQLGYFTPGFAPGTSNTADWDSNWKMVDQTAYNPDLGYFTSNVTLPKSDDGSDPVFLDQAAYLWIHNSTVAESGSEWLLTRTDWEFIDSTVGCCDKTLADQWSTSELGEANPPVWGGQGGVGGGGTYTSTSNSYSLQTYGFETSSPIPEVSSSVVGIALMFGLVMKRRRPSRSIP